MKDRFFRRFIALSLLVTVLLFTGCSASRPIESTEEEARVVGTVGEFEVLYEEFRFIALTYKQTLINTYGEDIFDDLEKAEALSRQIKDYVYNTITANYAVLTMCREVGIEADDPILLESVQKKIEETIESLGGRRKYIKYLEENYLTDNFLRFNTCVDLMQNELFYVYVDDMGLIESEDNYEKISDIIEEKFIRTQHIYISKANGKPYEENKRLIEEAYARIENGEDFMPLVDEFGEDDEMTSDGIYIISGYMDSKYEDVAFNLNVGKYSEIVETDSAFYIIKRLEQDPLYTMWNYDTLCERYQQYTFLGMIDDTQKYLEFLPNEYLKSLNILDIE